MLMAALVMIPTVWLPDLKALSALGIVGVAATLTVTAAIAYTLISGIPSNCPLSIDAAPEVVNSSFLQCHAASSTPALFWMFLWPASHWRSVSCIPGEVQAKRPHLAETMSPKYTMPDTQSRVYIK